MTRLPQTRRIAVACVVISATCASPTAAEPKPAPQPPRPEITSTEQLGGAYALDLGSDASAHAEARPTSELACYLDLLPDGSVQATINRAVEGGPPGATLTQASAVRIDGERDDFAERMHKVLALIADGMQKEHVVEGDDSSPLVPADRLILRGPDTVEFARLLTILELCGKPDVMIWNVIIEVAQSGGDPLQVPTPLPRDIAGQGAAPGEALTVEITVQSPGVKIAPETGEPWEGEGPFAFAGRMLVYSVGFPGQPSGEGTIATGIAVSSASGLAKVFTSAHKNHEGAHITLGVAPAVVFGEVGEVLAAASEAGFDDIRFRIE